MLKLISIFITISAILILMLGIKNAYIVRHEIHQIKNKRSHTFVVVNIFIAVLFIISYLVFIFLVGFGRVHLSIFMASILFVLGAVFMYCASILTRDMGKLLFALDKARKLDSLTQIFNRRCIEKAIKKEFERCKRYNIQSCLVMLDINKFKLINDKYGHQVGDEVLIDLVNVIKSELRSTDIFGRYGGDEFIILMPETPTTKAKIFIQRLNNVISRRVVKTKFTSAQYAISIGLSELKPSMVNFEAWIHTVDMDLYESKANTVSG